MIFEHFALNVADVRAHAAWLVDNLGLKMARKRDDSPFTHFLSDDTGRVIIELYSNLKATVPDYAATHPSLFHIAFVAKDPHAERARLEAFGATFVLVDILPDGSSLVMMRDPCGVPIQLCQRVTSLNDYKTPST